MTRLSGWEEKLTRHRLFWEGKADGRPLIGPLVRPYIFPAMIHAEGRDPIYPESIDLPTFVDFYEAEYAASQRLLGDLLYVATPASGDPWGLPWMEAILGARIRRSGQHAWAEGNLDDWTMLDDIRQVEDNPWFSRLLEFIRVLVELADGRFPIGTCLMRGPADLAQALRGAKRFGYDLIESPDETKRLLQTCADAWVNVAKAQLELIPPFRGGYCSGLLPLWGPGTALVTQDDANFFFSPARYREMLLPVELHILTSFEYPLYHIHSGYTHTLNDLLAAPWEGAVDLSRDPTGPPLEELFPVVERIQRSGKRAVFHGEFASTEIAHTLDALSPDGLCLMVVTETIDEANDLLAPFLD
jgi:hypothetical protein